jgi:riboflavin transporter 2
MTKIKAPSLWLREISIPTYILVMCFAISSWIDINGAWVEVPLLVNELPESWNLPSYLVILIQIANIGPIAYTIAKKLAPNKLSTLILHNIALILTSQT